MPTTKSATSRRSRVRSVMAAVCVIQSAFMIGEMAFALYCIDAAHRSRHVEPADGGGRPHGDRAIAGRCLARSRTSGRHHRDAAEPVRTSGVRLHRDLADGRDDGGRARDRPGDQPALSELCGSPSEACLLAQSHDAGVLRSLGLLQRHALLEGPDQRTGPSPGDAPRRSVSARAQRLEAVRAVRDGRAAARDVAGTEVAGPVSAGAPARLPLR